LPAGARVDDAIRAAGGARPGVRLDGLNLAAKLVDGQQVAVGVAPAPGAAVGGGAAAPSGGSSGAPVNLNTATLDQLQTLPGVGPVLAQHVLDWRSQHGSFTSVAQLNDVTGIGDVKFAALKSLVTV
jgi:competence protein ComEA